MPKWFTRNKQIEGNTYLRSLIYLISPESSRDSPWPDRMPCSGNKGPTLFGGFKAFFWMTVAIFLSVLLASLH